MNDCEICPIIQKAIEDNSKRFETVVPRWIFILLTSLYIGIAAHQTTKINDIEKALIIVQTEIKALKELN